MTPNDYQQFREVLDRDCERRGKPKFSGGLLEEMFEDLEDISLEQFLYAAKCHRRSDQGQFGLSVASIRKQLGMKNLQDLTWVDVITMAKSKKTPLSIAIVANKYLISFDLENKSDIENRGGAEKFLSDLPKIAARLESGEFTEHEIILCAKYGIDCRREIHGGQSLPNLNNLMPRIERAKNSQNFKLMLEDKRKTAENTPKINSDGVKRIRNEIVALMNDSSVGGDSDG